MRNQKINKASVEQYVMDLKTVQYIRIHFRVVYIKLFYIEFNLKLLVII